jgi:hypothetical protein
MTEIETAGAKEPSLNWRECLILFNVTEEISLAGVKEL